MNSAADLLLRLRDVHAPPDPGWWPPAPGWWIAALLTICCGWLLARWLRPHVRRRRVEARLRRELRQIQLRIGNEGSTAEIASELSELLRRAVLELTGDTTLAGLHGPAWAKWLTERIHHADTSLQETRRLTELPYQSDIALGDVKLLAELVGQVLAANPGPRSC
ncbi:MAG: DUF4381 domain-containing protein [Pseudomonadota bacterium]